MVMTIVKSSDVLMKMIKVGPPASFVDKVKELPATPTIFVMLGARQKIVL
jgi:hypothetical protein